jgi:uncharacterized protein
LSGSFAGKKRDLENILGREKRVAVAYSGGVDSSLLLKIACDVLGPENTIAIFAETTVLPPGEAEYAKRSASQIGSRLFTVNLDPLSWPEFAENPPERCYLCKRKIYETFREQLEILDFHVLMDGTNQDDLREHRPGLKALAELHVKMPLAQVCLNKAEVRKLSRGMNLPSWNKHSSSCLATRVAVGQPINHEKIECIKKCESFLHSLDFQGCRVRLSGDSAVIELQQDDMSCFLFETTRMLVLNKFADFGIEKVLLDLKGRKKNV